MKFFGDKVRRSIGHTTVMIEASNGQVNGVIYRNKHYSSEKKTVSRFRNMTNKNVVQAVTVNVSFMPRSMFRNTYDNNNNNYNAFGMSLYKYLSTASGEVFL